MLSKNQQKFIKTLHSSKARKSENKFIIEGPKIVDEFLNSKYTINQIFATEDWLQNNHHLYDCTTVISEKDLKSISLLKTPNKVLAVLEKTTEKQFEIYENDLTLALDTIQDPGNLGTIIRIADWFGIKNIVMSSETTDVYNPKVVQATMGSIARVNFLYTNLEEWIKKINSEIPIYGALLNGENIYKAKLEKRGIIIIGNESSGISSNIEKLIQHKLKIPSFNNSQTDSLNAAIATAIICAEFRR